MTFYYTNPTLSSTIVREEIQENFEDVANTLNTGITDDNLATDSVTTSKIADDAVTQAKIADNALDGTVVGNTANANAIGGIPILHRINIADGAGTTSVTLTHKTLITDAWLVKTGSTGGASDTLQLTDSSDNAITDAMDMDSAAVGGIVRATSLDPSYSTVAAGTALKAVATNGTNNACVVYVLGLRVA